MTTSYTGPKNGTHGLVASNATGTIVFRFKSEAHADAKLAFYRKHGSTMATMPKVALVNGELP